MTLILFQERGIEKHCSQAALRKNVLVLIRGLTSAVERGGIMVNSMWNMSNRFVIVAGRRGTVNQDSLPIDY